MRTIKQLKMKKFIIIAIAIIGLTLTSCGGNTTEGTSTATDSTSVKVDSSSVVLDSTCVVNCDTTKN